MVFEILVNEMWRPQDQWRSHLSDEGNGFSLSKIINIEKETSQMTLLSTYKVGPKKEENVLL